MYGGEPIATADGKSSATDRQHRRKSRKRRETVKKDRGTTTKSRSTRRRSSRKDKKHGSRKHAKDRKKAKNSRKNLSCCVKKNKSLKKKKKRSSRKKHRQVAVVNKPPAVPAQTASLSSPVMAAPQEPKSSELRSDKSPASETIKKAAPKNPSKELVEPTVRDEQESAVEVPSEPLLNFDMKPIPKGTLKGKKDDKNEKLNLSSETFAIRESDSDEKEAKPVEPRKKIGRELEKSRELRDEDMPRQRFVLERFSRNGMVVTRWEYEEQHPVGSDNLSIKAMFDSSRVKSRGAEVADTDSAPATSSSDSTNACTACRLVSM